MAFNIDQFKDRGLVFGGARPSLFQVTLTYPSIALQGVSTARVEGESSFLIRSAQIPAATIPSIEVPYFGRRIKISGERTFADWSTTVMNDEDFELRKTLENWMRGINSHIPNVMDPSFLRISGSNPKLGYKANLNVTQFSKVGKPLRNYTFVGAFPINVSEIALDWEATNRVETFDVTWSYDYWVVGGEDEGFRSEVVK
jgi:hypothetical protein